MHQTLKKIKYIFLFSVMILVQSLSAQESALSISGGLTEDGNALIASYNYYMRNDNFFQASVFVSFAKDPYKDGIKIPYNDFTVNAGYYKRVFKTKNNAFKASIGGGGVFGYEAINNGNKELSNGALIKSKAGFIYGAFIGLDTDLYLSDDYSVVLKINEYYHHNSDMGQFTAYAGIGIRYYFN